jgi:hypothetical protein
MEERMVQDIESYQRKVVVRETMEHNKVQARIKVDFRRNHPSLMASTFY